MSNAADSRHAGSSAPPSEKPRIPYACEACRAAKVKCQPGSEEKACRRCATSKRECVFKTGLRTRRRRSKIHPAATRKTPPPSAPSKTFTIDVPMTVEDSVGGAPSDTLDILRESHEGFIDSLISRDVLQEDDSDMSFGDPATSASGSRAFSASTPSVGSRPIHGFSSIQPQFNLDSATALLATFREHMLPYFPVTILKAETGVSELARERPFVLLAILAAASGNRSLQGHTLYDEEFRKILGLKFVSSGERSLELLVGLLIYCAWYPFHLRPKNRQALQYIRMASDLVHDLCFDQALDDTDIPGIRVDEESMAGIRAYLASYYMSASFVMTWNRGRSLPYQQWTATCCDLLVGDEGDQGTASAHTLVWLVRLGLIMEETMSLARRQGKVQLEYQNVLLMIKGLEAQFQEWQAQIPADIRSQPVLQLMSMFTKIILNGDRLLGFPYNQTKKRHRPSSEPSADPVRLLACANALRTWYHYIATLPDSVFAHFTGVQWAYFVIAIVLGLRLSFPIPNECPGWDHAAARQILDLGWFLDKFSDASQESESSRLVPASSKKSANTDVLSAGKVVVGVVKRRYDRRLAALDAAAAAMGTPHPMPAEVDKPLHKCPMFDGSLDEYIQSWDDTFLNTTNLATLPFEPSGIGSGMGNAFESPGAQPLFHDLWATMTMGWSQEGFGDMDFSGI